MGLGEAVDLWDVCISCGGILIDTEQRKEKKVCVCVWFGGGQA